MPCGSAAQGSRDPGNRTTAGQGASSFLLFVAAVTTSDPLPDHLELGQTDRQQIAEVLAALRHVLRDGLVGAYLHGSAVLGGLRPLSDIDVLAISVDPMTRSEKTRLIERLLAISGTYPGATPPRPVELTIVLSSKIRPWRYPPTMVFEYGEWWRDEFERGEVEPWPSATNPDIALLVTMVLLGDVTIVGPPPAEVLDPVPKEDFGDALVAGVPHLVEDIDRDTRNVVLTLARIWNGLATGAVQSKDAAADWALPFLPSEHRPVLVRARDIYLGLEEERWYDLHDRIQPFVDAVVRRIASASV